MGDDQATKQRLLEELQALRARIAEREPASEAAEPERNRLRMLMDHLPDHVYFKDRESKFIQISAALADKHGLHGASEAIGKSDFDFFTQEHAQPAFDDEQRIIATGEPVVGLVEKETWADGHVTWVTTTKLPLKNDAGETIGTFGVSRDITDLKRAEEATRESETLYRSLMDNLTQNIFRKDREGRVTFVNRQYCKTMGMTSQELLGKTDFDLFPKELASKYVADDQQVMETGKPLELVEEHQARSGETIYVQVIKTPIYDAEGSLIGTQGMFWDVTAKKRYEETLVRLAAIVEGSQDAIIGTTLDGVILSWNPGAERMYGLEAKDAIGKRISMLVPPERQYEVDAIKEQINKGQRIANFETIRQAADGRRFDVSVSVSPIRNGDGRIVGISGITRDITERKRAEQATYQLASIVESSTDAILGLTLEGNVTIWNPAAERLFGYAEGDIRNQTITRISPEGRKEEVFDLIGRVAREERIDDFATEYVHQDGTVIPVMLTVSPIVDRDADKVTGISIIARRTL